MKEKRNNVKKFWWRLLYPNVAKVEDAAELALSHSCRVVYATLGSIQYPQRMVEIQTHPVQGHLLFRLESLACHEEGCRAD